MKNGKSVSEHVRPMLAAMARSIEAARAKRTAAHPGACSRSSEGTTSTSAHFTIGNQTADNGKAKASPKLPASSFFRERGDYRKAG